MLFIVGLFSLLSINVLAQNKVLVADNKQTKPCSGEKFVMPSTIADGNKAFETYLKVASLQMTERKEAFSRLSNDEKSTFIKVNLALQFVKRPNMTDVQRQFVLDSMTKVSADLFDKSDYEKVKQSEQSATEIVNKAFGLFSRKDAGDFVEPLNTDKSEEISLLQKYEDLLKIGSKKRMRVAKEMPLDERVNIWKIQLAYHLATGKFSKSQNDFILKMLTELSPETFTSRLNLTEEEESKAEKLLLSSILSVFTKQEGYAVFMTIGIQKYIKDVQIVRSHLKNSLINFTDGKTRRIN